MKDRSTSPYTIEVLAPSLAGAQKEAERLGKLPVIAQVITLASFVPKEQNDKLALIQDAAMLIGPTLQPDEIKAPPTDQQVVASLKHAAAALIAAAGSSEDRPARRAKRLARLANALAAAPPQRRAEAETQIIPGLKATLKQLGDALQAQPITLKILPPQLVGEWIAADGRARIEVFPKGDPNDNEAMRQFADAVLKVALEATGAPISVLETSRTVVNAFMEAGVLAFLAITLMLAFVLRRFHDVIVTLLPLLLSGLATLSISVAVGLPLNFANIIALPLLFGIGVAFNIYFVMAWRNGTGDLLSSSLTRAILYSALTTGTAFGSPALEASRHGQHGQSLACRWLHPGRHAALPAGPCWVPRTAPSRPASSRPDIPSPLNGERAGVRCLPTVAQMGPARRGEAQGSLRPLTPTLPEGEEGKKSVKPPRRMPLEPAAVMTAGSVRAASSSA
jgi:hypothetical protein